ncbi:MAG: response regulator [Planctomycetota bacterium]|jgi:CheY-like chemotaxis protein
MLRILVAEDSRLTRDVVTSMLESWGHEVHAVEDGREAVAAATSGSFGLVLLDLELPGMGGLEATAAIRAQDKELPIIAMTAHRDRRDECIAAGMSGYITKPIRADGLRTAMDQVRAGLDWSAALHSLAGRASLLETAVAAFVDEGPALLREISDAVEHGDAERLARAAHTIRGSLGYFGVQRPVELAGRLEDMGRGADLGSAPDTLAELETEVQRLLPHLEGFRKS